MKLVLIKSSCHAVLNATWFSCVWNAPLMHLKWYKWDKERLYLDIMRMPKETIMIDYHNTSGLDLLDLSYYFISMVIRHISFFNETGCSFVVNT